MLNMLPLQGKTYLLFHAYHFILSEILKLNAPYNFFAKYLFCFFNDYSCSGGYSSPQADTEYAAPGFRIIENTLTFLSNNDGFALGGSYSSPSEDDEFNVSCFHFQCLQMWYFLTIERF